MTESSLYSLTCSDIMPGEDEVMLLQVRQINSVLVGFTKISRVPDGANSLCSIDGVMSSSKTCIFFVSLMGLKMQIPKNVELKPACPAEACTCTVHPSVHRIACLYNTATCAHVPANNTSSCSNKEEEETHTNTADPPIPPRCCCSTPSIGRMLLLRATPFAYAKVDKVDADEARHWKARFLVHKVLEGKGPPTRRPAALARGGGCRVVRAARIGVRLKRLRLAVRTIRLRVYRSVHKHLRNLRRLAHGTGSPRS